jgi:hypothetical protein
MDQATRSSVARNRTAAWVSTVALIFGLTVVAQAGDRVDEGGIDASLTAPRRVALWIQPSMNSKIRSKLTTAFDLAVARVEESPQCAALFDEIGTDGIDMLAATLYFPAPAAKKTTTCRRSEAYTYVGEAPTFLCDNFRSLTAEQAALVLIHEALHHSGLEESPWKPGAPSSAAINQAVRTACGFQVFKTTGRAG